MELDLKEAMKIFREGKRNTEVWVLCTDENYPECDDCKKCAVKYEDADGWHYFIYSQCPLGWTTLMKMGAFCKMLD